MKQCSVGGQGVIEGVMMRSPRLSALAVRKADGTVIYKKTKLVPPSDKHKFYGLPVVRGVVNFVNMLAVGVTTITDSAQMYDEELAKAEEPSKLEKYVAKKTGKSAFDVAMVFAVILSLAIGVGLFFVLPTLIGKYLLADSGLSDIVRNLIEGLVRLAIFVGYMVAVSLIKDIKRVYMYHGAEHKTIHCYEHEEELSVQNIQKYKTLHPRCGTSYLFLVMAVSIIVYSIVDSLMNLWIPGVTSVIYYRIGLRILMLPLIAGIAFEILKFAGRRENWFTKILRAPGMALQKLTTKQPTDDMVEVATVALYAALDEKSDEELLELCKQYGRPASKPGEGSTAQE